MSWNAGRVARAAIGAVLSATLAVGGVVPSIAWAAPGDGKGTLTIHKADSGNNVSSYKAIKVFKADVHQDSESGKWMTSELSWASDAVKAAVIDAINDVDASYASEDAQDAAEFLASHIQGSSNTTIVLPNDFANDLAKKIGYAVADSKNSLQANYVLTPDQKQADVDEGYYLVIVDPAELAAAGSAGTSPILLMVGEDQNVEVTEKVTVPTLAKTVTEDSDVTAVAQYADAQAGQEVPFRLTGTVAGNIAGYDTYAYGFTDTLSKGLTLRTSGGTSGEFDNGDVTVRIVNTNDTNPVSTTTYTVTSGYDASYQENADDPKAHDLKVSFADLKAAQGIRDGEAEPTPIPVDASSVVTVEYAASLNSDAVAGLSTGNPNTAVLEYSDMPNFVHKGRTEFAEARVYELALKLIKVDKEHELDDDSATNTVLSGAKFTIRAIKTDEGDNDGKYLRRDGSFGVSSLDGLSDGEKAEYVFVTGADGSFTVKGLDGGKALDDDNKDYAYTIHEVEAPTGYGAMKEDLHLNIKVNKDQDTLQPISVTTALAGGEDDGPKAADDSGAETSKGTRVTTDADGTVVITATNQKEELPPSGLSGITMVYVAGGAILVVSLAVIVRRNIRKDEQS